jgi:hypothetical protein
MEPRRHTRFPKTFPVSVEVKGSQFQAMAQNISFGGVMVSAGKWLTPGALVKLRFNLGEAGEIELKGYVRHGDEGRGGGVEFIEVLQHQQAKLSGYLSKVADSLSGPAEPNAATAG